MDKLSVGLISTLQTEYSVCRQRTVVLALSKRQKQTSEISLGATPIFLFSDFELITLIKMFPMQNFSFLLTTLYFTAQHPP